MKFTLLISFLLFFVNIEIVYGAPNLCEDLGKYSCSNGVIDDGTGTARRFTFDDIEKMTQLIAQTGTPLHADFEQKLKDPKNKLFRMLATSAFGLSGSPSCDKKNPAHSEPECLKKIADELTLFSKSKAFGMTKADSTEISENLASPQFLSEKFLLANNEVFQGVQTQFEKKIDQQLNTTAIRAKISNTIFPEVQKQMIARIKRMTLPDDSKELMIAKIEAAKFDPADCANQSGISKYFEPNANSNPINGKILVCSALLRMGDSEFMLASVIAHEIAHQIDPCGIAIGPDSHKMNYKDNGKLEYLDSQYPVQGLLYCLRSKKSVGAINALKVRRDLAAAQQAAKLAEAMATMGGAATGGSVNYPIQYPNYPTQLPQAGEAAGTVDQGGPVKVEEAAEMKNGYSYCAPKQDQIGESVSDWFSAEILPEYISSRYPNLTSKQWQDGAANAMRALDCDESTKSDFDEHPPSKMRINAIISQHPKMREKLQCPAHSKYTYCDANNPEKLLKDFGPVAAKRENANPKNPYFLPNANYPYGGAISYPILPVEQGNGAPGTETNNPKLMKGGSK